MRKGHGKKMKNTAKTLAIVLASVISLTFAACGGQTANESNTRATPIIPQEEEKSPQETIAEEIEQHDNGHHRPFTEEGENDGADTVAGINEDIVTYTDGNTNVRLNYSADTISVDGSVHIAFFDIKYSDDVITAFTEPMQTFAPDDSISQEQHFITLTIDGDTMLYEYVFVLTRNPELENISNRMTSNAVLIKV
ncbi:MAG: hypothetical protein LBC86_08025 [Oscillospiraceae bacterium]|nr:hypothetical protein [Oscillospiraceae bacterium]